MNINLTRQEKDFLFIKHRKEGNSINDSNKKVNDLNRSIRQIREMERFEIAKQKAFIKNFKDNFNSLK